MNPNYQEFLYKLGLFNIKLGLSTIREMLHRMGDPHLHPQIIHIAGTNGKGSTLVTLEQLLIDSGFKTGSTISPHLYEFNERFRICGCHASNSELDKAFESVCDACGIELDRFDCQPGDGTVRPTFFEFSIAMAFEIFRDHAVDYILLETGLGGRLDATNVVNNPLACVLTRISIDHQDFLGESLEEITAEKLGIVKKGSPVFVAWQEGAVSRQIRQHCQKMNVVAYHAPEQFSYRMCDEDASIEYYFSDYENQEIRFGSSKHSVKVHRQALVGDHQYQNTSAALAVYYSIISKNKCLSNERVSESLQKVFWRGRLEYLGGHFQILLDGAHNKSAIQCLFRYLKQRHKTDKILFAIAWKQDKQFLEAIDTKGLIHVEFIPIAVDSEKATRVEQIAKKLEDRCLTTHPSLNVKQLIAALRNNSLPRHDLLVITGSLYLIGEFLANWPGTHSNVGKT